MREFYFGNYFSLGFYINNYKKNNLIYLIKGEKLCLLDFKQPPPQINNRKVAFNGIFKVPNQGIEINKLAVDAVYSNGTPGEIFYPTYNQYGLHFGVYSSKDEEIKSLFDDNGIKYDFAEVPDDKVQSIASLQTVIGFDNAKEQI